MSQIRTNALCMFLHEGNILAGKGVDKKTDKVFYRLFGGGIEIGETSEEAIIREIKEELGATAINLKKLSVTENIFEYQGNKMHEITFLYKGDILEKSFYENKDIARIDKEGYAYWIPIQDILSGKNILYPEQARDYLTS